MRSGGGQVGSQGSVMVLECHAKELRLESPKPRKLSH